MAISPEKLNELMLKVRKGATSSLSLSQLEAIVEAIGGKVETFVGLVRMTRRGDRNYVWADSAADATRKHEQLKKLLGKPPAKPKAGTMYVLKLDEVVQRGADDFEIPFDSVTATESVKVELGGKSADLNPSQHSLQEAQEYLEKGPQKRPFRAYELVDWLAKNTDWVERVNKHLGMGEHVPAEARTRDRTGSCPVCFQNVKLIPEKNTIVLHGYQRPGTGTVHGKCYGVGFAPFELSVKGTKEYLERVLEPQLAISKAYAKTLEGDDLQSFTLRDSHIPITRDNPKFDFQLKVAREDSKRRIEYHEAENKAYGALVTHWKERPLPKEGERHIDWFYAGQKSASVLHVLRAQSVAERFSRS